MLPLFGVRRDKAGTALSLLSPISSTIVICLIVLVNHCHHHHIHQLMLCTILLLLDMILPLLDCRFFTTKLIFTFSALSINFILTLPLLGLNPVLIYNVARQISKPETIIVIAVIAVTRQGLHQSFQRLGECMVFL
jgi:hypothetical protein